MIAAWYLVRVRTRMELRARNSLLEKGFVVYLPMIAKDRRNKAEGLEPLFPGYLPVQLTLGEDDTSLIKSARGCVDLVRFGDHLAKFPSGCVENLIAGADLRDVARNYKAGDAVRVRSGAFHDLRGTMAKIASGDRADVLLELLGCVSRVSIPVIDLEPA